MAELYWVGTTSASWAVAANWIDENGDAAAAAPVSGDSVYFVTALGAGDSPATHMDQSTVTLEKIIRGASYDGGIGLAYTPLVIGARRVTIDATGATADDGSSETYLATLPQPDLIVRSPSSSLDKDHTTITAAIAAADPNDIIYVIADNGGSTTFTEAVSIDKVVEIYAIGDVTIDGDAGALVDFASPATSAAILQGFTITNGSQANGGGIVIPTNVGATVRRCTIKANSSSGNGGGIYIAGGHAVGSDLDISIEDCTLTLNSSSLGAGIVFDDVGTGQIRIERCRITDNTAANYGGAFDVYSSAGTPDIEFNNCLIDNNTNITGTGYGTLSFTAVLSTEVSINNCTIADNAAKLGGAIYIAANTGATFNSCTLWDNSAVTSGDTVYIVDGATSDLVLDWSDTENVGGSGASIALTGTGVVYGANPAAANDTRTDCIDADPEFTAPTGDLPYNILAASPCYEAADDTWPGGATDLVYSTRTVENDCGCYLVISASIGSAPSVLDLDPRYQYARRFGGVVVVGGLSADSTVHISGEIEDCDIQKGFVDFYNQPEVVTTIRDSLTYSYKENPKSDVSATITYGTVVPAIINVFGGLISAETRLADVAIFEGKFSLNTISSGVSTYTLDDLTIAGGAFDWLNGDVDTCAISRGTFDASDSVNANRTLDNLSGSAQSVINLDDGAGAFDVVNPIEWQGKVINFTPGARFLIDRKA